MLLQIDINLLVVNETTNNIARISDRMLWIWPTQHYETLRAISCPLVFLQPKPLNCLAFRSFQLIWYLRFNEAFKNICGQMIHTRHVRSKGYILNMWDNMIHPRHLWENDATWSSGTKWYTFDMWANMIHLRYIWPNYTLYASLDS